MMPARIAFVALMLAGPTVAAASVVVETVEQGGTAGAAGLDPGDVLESWERGPENGPFSWTFDVETVEATQAPLGRVTIRWLHDGQALSAELAPDRWRIVVRPDFRESVLQEYLEAIALAESGDGAEAAGLMEALASRSGLSEGDSVWLLTRAGRAHAEAGDWASADAAYERAFEMASTAGTGRAVMVRASQGDLHYRQGQRYVDAGRWYGEAAALQGSIDPGGLLMADLHTRLGWTYRDRGEFTGAMDHFQESLRIREEIAPASLHVAWALINTGFMHLRLGKPDAAEVDVKRAVAIVRGVDPECFALGQAYLQMSNVYLIKRDVALAREYQKRSLAIYERWRPDSLSLAMVFNNMGALDSMAGDFEAAEDHNRRALAIREKLAPGTLHHAYSLANLGEVARRRGDLPLAEDYYRQAIPVYERLAPDGHEVADSLFQRGEIAKERGDLARAEDFHSRALAIRERIVPGSTDVASSLNAIGFVSRARGDLPAAKSYYLRALPVAEAAKDPLEVSFILDNLGEVARLSGDPAEARRYFDRALELKSQVVEDSIDLVTTLRNLAALARERGDIEEADRLVSRARVISERDAPESLLFAKVLAESASIALERGDGGAAESLLRQVDAIRTRLAPGSVLEAESAAAMARLLRRRGDHRNAGTYYDKAIRALESQQGRLGGVEEVRTAFRSRHMDIYREQIDLLVGLGREEEAFALLERSRARGLRELLAERELIFAADIPPDLDARRRTVASSYDMALEALAETRDSEEGAELMKRLGALRNQREQIRDEIRRRFPRLAALQNPEPLDLAGAREALGSGTALMSFSVAERKTHLFVIDDRGRLSLTSLPVGEQELIESTREFRRAIQDSRNGSSEKTKALGRELFDALVRPVKAKLESSERLLIVPDGPLHLLPFAALVMSSTGGNGSSYLVEWKPVHVAVSVTVYDELRERAPVAAPSGPAVLAFGDPSFPGSEAGTPGDPVVRSLLEMGAGFDRLPATREEVGTIAALFPESAVTYLGEEATEERAKTIEGARIIHFATHGLVDERFPLDSAIVLSIPESVQYGRDNGLLQAWEILESVRVDTSLVTLSGCETALGKEMAGEGIVGLTRAFHYAGARSVLASLWNVSDRSTSELMKRFYGHLRDGLPKDMALRAAQIEMIRGDAITGKEDGMSRGVKKLAKSTGDARYDSPYYWAAFELLGDPR